MKLGEIVRFEIAYQIRRPHSWLFFLVLLVAAFQTARAGFLSDALYNDFYVNSPFIIAFVSVITSLLWLVTAATIAGDAAARDVATRMDPLAYTAPVSKAQYLGGRFLGALALNALLLLAVPTGILLSLYLPGIDPRVVGPFNPAAYLTAFAYIALPNAFVGTSIQFAWAALGRRPILAYLGSVFLLFVAYGGFVFITFFLQNQRLAALFDVFGHIFMTDDMILGWTSAEKRTRLIELEGQLLASRLTWFGFALATLAFTYARFRVAHPAVSPWWSRIAGRRDAHAPTPGGSEVATSPIIVPRVRQRFDGATHAKQALAIAWVSFRTIATGRGGIVVLAAIAGIVVLVLPQNLQNLGTPLIPATGHVLTFLTTPLTNPLTPWVIIPLLTVLYAGELVWRERDAGLGEITEGAPVPEWVTILGKFLGLGLVLVMWMLFLATAGVLVQLRMGYDRFEIGLYLRVLLGLQLPEYLLFALLALVVQGLVTQKYLGHLAALLVYASILFASVIGIDTLASRLGVHPALLTYGGGPGWSHSDMRGFGSSLGPWLWFRLYWTAWALLLAVAARLLWMRGMEGGRGARLRLARQRLTRSTAAAALLATGLVLALGGFVFYNTSVLGDYAAAAAGPERSAEYERRYRRYAELPQPALAAVALRVELYPGRREAQVRGTYHLVNRTGSPIDSIHLATVPGVETGAVALDRPGTRVLADGELGHSIFALRSPLQPGDSLRLTFEVRRRPRGFGGTGVHENGSWFTNEDWLPAMGYQARRELIRPGERREHGLPARPLLPTLEDVQGAQDITGEGGTDMHGTDRIAVETVVGTDADQVAVAPGVLRRTWREGGRRYFHYATDAPIGNQYSVFSARYAVREARWKDVAIRLFHHPGHTANVDRILRSAIASLEHNSREFGPYRYRQLTLVENASRGFGAHAEASVVDYGQGFALWNTEGDRRGLDFPFAVMAHEMGHQFCCPIAYVEGAGLLTESFAWYAAMGVVEETYGREHLRRLLRFFRQPHPIPPIRQSVPLLRGMDPYAAYRKGPFAFFALREYMGAERVNGAFRSLLDKHASGALPAPTSLDLYRELQAVAPDSLRYLVRDLIAENTLWEMETERAAARRTPAGAWQVTLDVRARKVRVDTAGVETEVPMDEWVQVGVFAATGQGAEFGEQLYLRMHRIRSGEQTITVTVPREPSDAGVDPYHLLLEEERLDNVEEVHIES